MLRDESEEPREVKTVLDSDRTSKTVKVAILSSLNTFLTDCLEKLAATCFRVHLKDLDNQIDASVCPMELAWLVC